MARTVITCPFRCSFDEAEKKIAAILAQHNFSKVTLKTGESVWKKGVGLLTAMQFVKVEYSQAQITLSAWVQSGVGNIGGKEMELKGAVAAIPKKQLLKVIEEIKNSL